MTDKLIPAAAGTFACMQIVTHAVEPIIKDGMLESIDNVGILPNTKAIVFDAYVCGYCDNTHFVITDVFGKKALNLALSPMDVEALGRSLINPVPRG